MVAHHGETMQRGVEPRRVMPHASICPARARWPDSRPHHPATTRRIAAIGWWPVSAAARQRLAVVSRRRHSGKPDRRDREHGIARAEAVDADHRQRHHGTATAAGRPPPPSSPPAPGSARAPGSLAIVAATVVGQRAAAVSSSALPCRARSSDRTPCRGRDGAGAPGCAPRATGRCCGARLTHVRCSGRTRVAPARLLDRTASAVRS